MPYDFFFRDALCSRERKRRPMQVYFNTCNTTAVILCLFFVTLHFGDDIGPEPVHCICWTATCLSNNSFALC
jgi:hypothetical protein